MAASSPTTHRNRPTATTAITALLAFAAVTYFNGIPARYNFLGTDIQPTLRTSSSISHGDNSYELLDTTGPLARLHNDKEASSKQQQTSTNSQDDDYFVFLQKFPLQNTWQMIFHTEVVVCPRSTFDDSADFLSTLDHLLEELTSNNDNKVPFVQVPEDQWTTQSNPTCVQLGYGGNICPSTCCGSPHEEKNTKYALNSRQAVIGNAMGDAKQLYLYGRSDDISGMDAYRAVCAGTSDDASKEKEMPTCVSNWAGTDYNPLTNNCNTFTSTILKCVYGLSDSKPNLGVSDLVTVACPLEEGVQQCLIPVMKTRLGDVNEVQMKKVE